MAKKLTLAEEELLCDLVYKNPLLYDECNKYYKDENCAKEAWEKISNSLEFTENGDAAEMYFIKVKKRYLKRRNEVRKNEVLGKRLSATSKAQRELESFSFLNWLDQFLRHREMKCSKQRAAMQGVEESDSNSIKEDISSEKADEDLYEIEDVKTNLNTEINNIQTTQNSSIPIEIDVEPSPKRMKRHPNQDVTLFNNKHTKGGTAADDLSNNEKTKTKENVELDDEEEIYVRYIVSQLRKFDEIERCTIKHDINDVIFKYEMNKLRSKTTTHAQQLSP